jgi:hypothetical protein
VHGAKAFKAQFHALPKLFKSATWSEVQQAHGAHVVYIRNKQARALQPFRCCCVPPAAAC